ncbi:MAG: hypothetical protein LQ351_003414 [Letrouitia transgressa]|nr:MAG: hypothetical protein LQ351_003414 [Letrouitia transgressa]
MPDGNSQALQPVHRGLPRGLQPRLIDRSAARELAEPADPGLEPVQLGEEVPVPHAAVTGGAVGVELREAGVVPGRAAEVPAVEGVEAERELGGLGVHAATGEEEVGVDVGGIVEARAVVVGGFLQGEGLVVVSAVGMLVDEEAEFRRQDGEERAGALRVCDGWWRPGGNG